MASNAAKPAGSFSGNGPGDSDRGGGGHKGGYYLYPNNKKKAGNKRKTDDDDAARGNQPSKRSRGYVPNDAVDTQHHSVEKPEEKVIYLAPALPSPDASNVAFDRSGSYNAQNPGQNTGFTSAVEVSNSSDQVPLGPICGHPRSCVKKLDLLAAKYDHDPDARWFLLQGNAMMADDRRPLVPSERAAIELPAANRRPISRSTPAPKSQPAPPLVVDGHECAWCMKRTRGRALAYAKTHRLFNCVWPSRANDIPGCPRCNTMEHHWDNCPEAEGLSEDERMTDAYNYLVRNRGGMPPIRSVISWPQLAIEMGTEPRFGFPATKAVVRQRFREDTESFERYYENRVVPFLVDEMTETLESIRQNLQELTESEVFVPRQKEGDLDAIADTAMKDAADPREVPLPAQTPEEQRRLSKELDDINEEEELDALEDEVAREEGYQGRR